VSKGLHQRREELKEVTDAFLRAAPSIFRHLINRIVSGLNVFDLRAHGGGGGGHGGGGGGHGFRSSFTGLSGLGLRPGFSGTRGFADRDFLIAGIAVALIALIMAFASGVLIATTVSFSDIISSSDLISRHSGFQDGGAGDIRTTMAITLMVMPTAAMMSPVAMHRRLTINIGTI
jgi:hypothetical protein